MWPCCPAVEAGGAQARIAGTVALVVRDREVCYAPATPQCYLFCVWQCAVFVVAGPGIHVKPPYVWALAMHNVMVVNCPAVLA